MGEQEPIFKLAVECEELFATRLAALKNNANGQAMLTELNRKFTTWAAFLGVFAKPKMCLDYRLRNHVEIQDQVLRLLDILQRNLTFLFEDDESSIIDVQTFEAISGAIERLNHLGIAIRQSSVRDQSLKARRFAEGFNLSSFENVARLALEVLYPFANKDLREQLAQSMVDIYSQFLYCKERYRGLQARRELQHPDPLETIDEDQETERDTVSKSGHRDESRRPSRPYPQLPCVSKSLPLQPAPPTEPTSIDTRQLWQKLNKTPSNLTLGNTQTVVATQVDYPRPAKGSMSCQWCFQPLGVELVHEDVWNRHLNQDHKPYVCISERCSEALVRFSSSTEWLRHMSTVHGSNWYREAHTPWNWICPACHDEAPTFAEPEDLADHLKTSHPKTFKDSQIPAITQQSRFRAIRPRRSCPLCCMSVKPKDGKREGAAVEADTHSLEPEEDLVQIMANHVGSHLQGIMTLALRLITVQVDEIKPSLEREHQEISSSTQDISLRVYSEQSSIARLEERRTGSVEAELSSHGSTASTVPFPAPAMHEDVDWDRILSREPELEHNQLKDRTPEREPVKRFVPLFADSDSLRRAALWPPYHISHPGWDPTVGSSRSRRKRKASNMGRTTMAKHRSHYGGDGAQYLGMPFEIPVFDPPISRPKLYGADSSQDANVFEEDEA